MIHTKPYLLTHTNIPKPLHGVNPRSVLGKKWWDKTRREAYRRYDYHCAACGVHKSQAKKHQWLEGHENYDIDYDLGIIRVHNIEPLCHYCHNFIHSGKLAIDVKRGERKEWEAKAIIKHGFQILKDHDLKCFPRAYQLAKSWKQPTYGIKPYNIPISIVPWEDWRIVIEGIPYGPKFKTYDEWKKHYRC